MTPSAKAVLLHGGRLSALRRWLGLEEASALHMALFVAVVAAGMMLRAGHLTQPLVDAFSWREASTAMMADNFRTGSWNILYPEVSWTGPGPSYQGREF